jgi:hypothetical protein
MPWNLIRPPNSIIFLHDINTRNVKWPNVKAGRLIESTESCVACGTLAEIDGETHVLLSNNEIENNLEMYFAGQLDAQSKKICISLSDGSVIDSIFVSSIRPSITIYANDDNEPSEIIIVALD